MKKRVFDSVSFVRVGHFADQTTANMTAKSFKNRGCKVRIIPPRNAKGDRWLVFVKEQDYKAANMHEGIGKAMVQIGG